MPSCPGPLPLTAIPGAAALPAWVATVCDPDELPSEASCPLAVVPSSNSTVNSDPMISCPEMPPTSQLRIAVPSTSDLAMPAIEFGSMSPEKPTVSPAVKPPSSVALNFTIAPL